jgi:hypothetical protein
VSFETRGYAPGYRRFATAGGASQSNDKDVVQDDFSDLSSRAAMFRKANNSELGFEYREYTCDMRVSLSLLKDS